MIIPLEHLFHWFSLRQYEFQMAFGVFGQLTTILSFETFAMLFCAKFGIVGIPAIFIYIFLPILAVIGMTYTGHRMVRSGYASKFQENAANINPEWIQLVKNVDCIKKRLDEQEKE